MSFGYLPVSGRLLEYILKCGVIRPPHLQSLLSCHSELDAKRFYREQGEDLQARIDSAETDAYEYAKTHPEFYEDLRKEGIRTALGVAFYFDKKCNKNQLSAIQKFNVVLFAKMEDANTPAHFAKQGSVLEIKVPKDRQVDVLSGIGSFYLFPEEIPAERIYRIYATNVPLIRTLLEENGSSADLVYFGAMSAE